MAKGGTEKHVLTLCRRQRVKYNIVLLAPEGEILPEFQKLDIHYVNFPELTGNVLKKIKIYKQRLHEIEQEHGIDLVHVHAAHEFVRFSRKVLSKTPIIFHLSAHQGSELSKAYNYWLSARISKKCADLLIAVSDEERRIVIGKGFPPEMVRVVYNGYEKSEGNDDEKIAQLKKKYGLEGQQVIGNLGRLHKTKRLDILIKALAQIKREGMDELKLLLIGEGPDRKRLEQIVQKEDLGDDVHFAGFISRGDRVLNIFDIFVLPTTFEGCSNVLIEAMAKGLPIITTNIPSVAWMFENGKNALLFMKNSVEDLHDCMKSLLKDEDLRNYLSHGALQRFTSEFEAGKMVQRTSEIYQELWH
jgi:glycosyltransferase involved in cell wall biosynthesis